MVYYIADTHFGHENVIGFCGRPFSSAAEMDEVMIERRNRKVHGNEMLLHPLSSFGFRYKRSLF